MATCNRRPFIEGLRKLGFQREWSDRPTKYNSAVMQYKLYLPDSKRFVCVQLSGDGAHRAAHGIARKAGHEQETTPPTEFSTMAGMYMAIARECTRESRDVSETLDLFNARTSRRNKRKKQCK